LQIGFEIEATTGILDELAVTGLTGAFNSKATFLGEGRLGGLTAAAVPKEGGAEGITFELVRTLEEEADIATSPVSSKPKSRSEEWKATFDRDEYVYS
jgi:hypothetical protein